MIRNMGKKKEEGMSFADAWKYRRKESLGLLALIALASCSDGRAGAKIITALVKGIYKERKAARVSAVDMDEEYCRTVLSRMRADGLVENSGRGVWGITEYGRKLVGFMEKKNKKPTPTSRAESDMIIVFDVPEKQRTKRARLRFELAAQGFSQLQKSVWLGKGPVDAEFMAFLKTNNLMRTVHMFAIAKRGTLRA